MSVIVLNASYERHQVVSLHHAIRMLHRGVAVVEEAVEGALFGPYPRPAVLRLVRFVYQRWAHDGPRYFSRRAVLHRDGRTCAYCGGEADTVDHVLPKSRGGLTTWLNLVAACDDCNTEKDARTPEEAGMRLLFRPHVPAGLRA